MSLTDVSTRGTTIACFGATGGCVGTALACALKNGNYCTAVARNSEKLRDFLTHQHNVPADTIARCLTIYQGDVKDQAIVKKALINPNDAEALVDVIVSGVGAYPTFQWSLRRPFPLTDPTICEDAIRCIFAALADLSTSSKQSSPIKKILEKPLLVVVSTAGCGRQRGIPLPIYFPYHYLLRSPLSDKQKMEELVIKDGGAHVRDFVIMRPLFLTDQEPSVDSGLRIGWEWGVEGGKEQRAKEPGPAIGYRISRKDIGNWIFKNVITNGGWEGKCVYVTY